jgi:integrase
VLDAVSTRSKARGYALRAALRACFNWAADKELIEYSPMDRMKSRQAPDAREHFLNEKEIVAFWRASGQMGFPWCYVYRLLLLTGCRREEVAAVEWAELDLEAGTWNIPGEKVKNGKFHIVDLPPLAVDIIRTVPKVTNDDGELQQLLFTSTGNTPPSGFSKAKTELDSLMKARVAALRPFRIHDLRRTIVSTLTEVFNYDEELGDRILNHKKKGITKVYNLATRRKERKEALLAWSQYILSLNDRIK